METGRLSTPGTTFASLGAEDLPNKAEVSDAITTGAPAAHAASHENGGSDEISVLGLSGLLADNQNPTAHATEHTDGTDDIQNATAAQKGLATATQITKLDGIAALADVTGSNAPQAHAASHVGADAIQSATAAQVGLATAAQITKLDGIETAADVTDAANVGSAIAGSSVDASPADTDRFAQTSSVGTLAYTAWSAIKSNLTTLFDTQYAPIGEGVTNGDSHNHNGGDGATIDLSQQDNSTSAFITAASVGTHNAVAEALSEVGPSASYSVAGTALVMPEDGFLIIAGDHVTAGGAQVDHVVEYQVNSDGWVNIDTLAADSSQFTPVKVAALTALDSIQVRITGTGTALTRTDYRYSMVSYHE